MKSSRCWRLLERACANSQTVSTPKPPTAHIPTPSHNCTIQRHHRCVREYSSSTATDIVEQLSPRWLSDVKKRLGKCLSFGLQTNQVRVAGSILDEIARDWRELLAGSEGFLTSLDRCGLHRQRVVWGEMDSMGHVNNVTYNRYAESGRVEWALKYAKYIDPTHAQAWAELVSPKSEGLILRKITTDFKFPMKWPDRVTVYHKLATEPTPTTEALVLDVVILSEVHQRPAARLAEDCAIYDYLRDRKVKLQPFMLEVFQETWRLQEQARKVNTSRIREILERVRDLEKSSWDRQGAVEDFGSAS